MNRPEFPVKPGEITMKMIEQYGHGGDVITAASFWGQDPSEIIDFSANINPLGPPTSVLQMLQKAVREVSSYPDPAQRTFRRKLVSHMNIPGLSEEMILVGNGAAECMALAILGLAPKKVGVIHPCFSEYEQLARSYGSEVIRCYGKEAGQLKPDMADLRRLFAQSDMVFIGHPNNPTGLMYSLEELREMAEWAEQENTTMVADEAFIDFLPPEQQVSLLPQWSSFPNMIVIRSLTKFYAIPGLRLGYAVAQPEWIRAMKEKQVTWSVNHLALKAGELCLEEHDYAERTRELISGERAFLTEQIANGLGWQVWPGKANYLLVRAPAPYSARSLQFLLGKKGFLIRNCEMYPGLTSGDFRIAVRTREENRRLISAMEEVVFARDERRR